MFAQAKSRVKWNGKLSTRLQNLHGVLQGGVLSPTLFKIFLSDLTEYLDSGNGISVADIIVFYLLFADDLILVAQTSSGLQSLISGLEAFCRQWEIEVNLVKTKYTIFNKQYATCQDIKTFSYNNDAIDKTDEYKYVGTVFSNSRNRFQKNFDSKIEKAKRAIYAARKTAREAAGNQLSPELYFKIFDTQIRPILDFGCEVWCNGEVHYGLEKVHTDYMKQTLGVKQQTTHLTLYGDTGRYPLVIKHQEMVLKYWFRLLSLNNDNPLRKMYSDLVLLDAQGHNTWCRGVKHILKSVNHEHLWHSQDKLDDVRVHKTLMHGIKIGLLETYKTHWENEVKNTVKHPKLRTYNLYKTSHEKEPCVFENFDNMYKRCISKFRVSSHRLRIETGRYENLPIEERLCVYCTGEHIDDEIHLLTECKYHNEERKLLFECAKQNIPGFSELQDSKDIFIQIMSTHIKSVLICLGKFLYSCFKKRGI